MDVSGNPCPGSFADVHSKVDSIRVVELAEEGLQALGEGDHFGGGIRGQEVEAVKVGVGDDHDVPRGVREGVDDDEAMLSTVEDEVALIVFRAGAEGGGTVTEDTGGSAVCGSDVGVAPWGEDVIHTGEGNKVGQSGWKVFCGA